MRINRLFVVPLAWLTLYAGAEKRLFNDDWQFALVENTCVTDEVADTLWTDVVLPHDWSIGLPFDKNAAPGNDGGYLPGGIGRYRTVLTLDKVDKERKYQLYFEGVYENSTVYVNGKLAGGHPYGYSSFFVDITPYLKSGNNEIEVVADNSRQKNCRWYSGSGIYRNVWLTTTGKLHIANHGVSVVTPELNEAVIGVKIDNESDKNEDVTLVVDVAGVSASETLSLKAGTTGEVKIPLSVPGAEPWSPDSPSMYEAKIKVLSSGKVVDEIVQPFGFRTIGYSAKEGFMLNGRPILLNGACLHHDNGILGAAAYDRAEWRKAELMKAAGFNAVRTSHNPPSEAFLNACDAIGLLVIDEAFDGWRDKKNDYDYHLLFDEWATRDVAMMIERDRNHPSIICWSIGNEIIERKTPQAVKDARMLAGVCHKIDPTRPVTQALASWDADWEIYDPLAAAHDIVGYNYMIHKAESDHQRVPERVMMQTESYPNDAWQNYCTTKDHSYIIGDFVWTGLDYIGESGIGRWYYEGDVPGEHYHRPLFPWHAAYCGDVDLTGLRKPISHYRDMLWNSDNEHLYIAVREPDGYNGKVQTTQWGTWPTFESWNWPGHEGKPIEVEVYSHYPNVRLLLGDVVVGEKEVSAATEMKAVFEMPYREGVLVAQGLDIEGKVAETVKLATAGEVADIRITADRPVIDADNSDLSFISIELVDAKGNVVPVADNVLSVDVAGPVSLIGLGNADIKENDPYYDATHKAWKGRALAVVRSSGKSGKASVTVTADVATGKLEKTLPIEIK